VNHSISRSAKLQAPRSGVANPTAKLLCSLRPARDA